jgi:hypothetical protein
MARKRRKGGSPTTKPVEPYWSPLPRQPLSHAQVAAIVARHAVPLGAVLFFGSSALQFCLLAVFGLAVSIAGIGVIGIAVSTRPIRVASNTADVVGSWITLALVGAVGSVVLTALFGWVIGVLGALEVEELWNAMLAWGVAATVAGALPGMWVQYRDDVRAGQSDEDRQRRDQPQVFTHLLCAGLIFILSGYAGEWGRGGAIALALAITALFVFRDLRPDLMRAFARPAGARR